MGRITGRLAASLCLVFGITLSAAVEPSAATGAAIDQPPPFLPPYYASALAPEGQPLTLAEHGEKDGMIRYVYRSADQVVTLEIGGFPCESPRCQAVYDNAFRFIDAQATQFGGRFLQGNENEMRAEWHSGLADVSGFVFKLPKSLLLWTYSVRLERKLNMDAQFDRVRSAVNRQRYEVALAQGNVDMGHWAQSIRDLAHELLRAGQRSGAEMVLKQLLATSPFDYDAQIDFVASTSDGAAARDSATVVLDNAESADLLTQAARYLHKRRPDLSSIPLLERGEKGLQLILVPLAPCDVQLLAEAGAIYEKITDVPVKVRRLKEEWRFGTPDRIPDQKRVQQAIIEKLGPSVDFTGWTLDRYKAALLATAEGRDAWTKFSIRSYVEKLDAKPPQYRADPYVLKFNEMLASYRSGDARTMYVGVTEDNIFSGDNNYLFSLFMAHDGVGASILSYSMMMAKTLGEPYESRKRLVERMAKELVPASLKALNIPRPTDPTDPYSYSDGVERLAQKTLVLSPPVKQALDKFR